MNQQFLREVKLCGAFGMADYKTLNIGIELSIQSNERSSPELTARTTSVYQFHISINADYAKLINTLCR